MTNFSHLEHLEDGKCKSENAKVAVQNLKNIVTQHDQKIKEEEAIAKRRKEAMEKIRSSRAVL